MKAKQKRPSKTPPKKRSAKEPLNCWPGELLREEFMVPFGITAKDIAKALPTRVHPKGPVLGTTYWETKIKALIGEEEEVGWNDGPDVLLFATLDRYFGLSEGYFLWCWVAAVSRHVAWNHETFLKKVKPLKRESSDTLEQLERDFGRGKTKVTREELQASRSLHAARKRGIVPGSNEPGVSLDGDLGYL
jgi:hypothetical protein